jgi:hypothetical protein
MTTFSKNDVFKKVRGFTSDTPGTDSYWWGNRRKSKAMTYAMEWLHDRIPTVFWTITPADNWAPTFFEQCLPESERFQTNLTEDSMQDTRRRQQLVGRHVAIAVEHFEKCVDLFVHSFLNVGLGAVDSLRRKEMQGRKTTHEHGISTCPDAPTPEVIQNACDYFQRFDSTDMPLRHLIQGTTQQQLALIEICTYVDNVLELSGSFPCDCRECQPAPKGGQKKEFSNQVLKTRHTSCTTAADKRGRACAMRERFPHKHSRSYCLRPRKSQSRVQSVNRKTADRAELKCRFKFFFSVCNCKKCLSEMYCDPHKARFLLEQEALCAAARGEAHANDETFMELQCVCDSCSCDCGANCKEVWAGCHLHVIRSTRDEDSKRMFRIYPARNYSALNCTSDAAMSSLGCMIDIQFLADSVLGPEYVTKYVLKAEPKSPAVQNQLKLLVSRAATQCKSVDSLIAQIYNAIVVGRDYGAWETASIAMGIDLCEFSRSFRSIGLSQTCCVAVDPDTDSDGEHDDVANEIGMDDDDEKTASSSYQSYGNRSLIKKKGCVATADKCWYWCAAWLDGTFKNQLSEAAVPHFSPHRECTIPRPNELGRLSEEDVAKYEIWCEHRLMMFVPWHTSHVSVKVGHSSYRAAFERMLPGWVHTLKLSLELGEAPLPEWPLDWECTLPKVLVREYARALLKRGYLRVDAHFPNDPEFPFESASESVDKSSSAADGGSSCDSVDAQAADLGLPDDGDADFVGLYKQQLDHLYATQTHANYDWGQHTSEFMLENNIPDFSYIRDFWKEHKPLGASEADFVPVMPDQLETKEGMDQRAVYDYVVGKISRGEQFFAILQGPAGCGKSFLFRAWRTELARRIKFLGTTGVAALIVNGETPHTCARLPVNRPFELLGASLAVMQSENQGVKMFALDERSMLGRKTGGQLWARAEEMTEGRPGTIGGISVLLSGDDMQLPPVLQKAIWDVRISRTQVKKPTTPAKSTKKPVKPPSKASKKRKAQAMQVADITVTATDKDLLGHQVYQKYFNSEDTAVFVFTDTYRQKDDLEFKKHVSRIRNVNTVPKSEFTQGDYEYWCRRDFNLLSQQEQDAFNSDNTLYLFDVNSKKSPKVHTHNTRKFCELYVAHGHPIARSTAVHSVPEAKHATETIAKGFQVELYLMKGMRVMLRKNVWTAAGLVNGSLGDIYDVLFDPQTETFVALVDFPSYTGPQAFVNCPKTVVPIMFEKAEFQVGKGKNGKKQMATRNQLPLVMAWATSIHKSQGMTIGPGKRFLVHRSCLNQRVTGESVAKVVIDVGKSESWAPGLMYVAISRATLSSCVAFDPMPSFERFSKLNTSQQAKEILKHLSRLEEISKRAKH